MPLVDGDGSKWPEDSTPRKAAREALYKNAWRWASYGDIAEVWLKHARTKFASCIRVVGEAELERIVRAAWSCAKL